MKLLGARMAAVALGLSLLFSPRSTSGADAATDPQVEMMLEALSRLKGVDLEANAGVKAAVMKVLKAVKGTPQFVEIVRDFGIKDQNAALIDFAAAHPTETPAADAIRLVLANNGLDSVRTALGSTNVVFAAGLVEALGNTGEKQGLGLLEPVVADKTRDAGIRKKAVKALAQTQEGATYLLGLARESKLATDLKLTASIELSQARWPALKKEAAELLPIPQGGNSEAIPSIAELMKRSGDAVRGAAVFRRETVGCIKCHQVNGEGMDFGPRLSEIGTKLGKDALYESIIDPSSGISFGYEAWQVELKNGDEAFGLISSETADELAIKTQNGIVTRYKKSEISKREQQKMSIMPAGLTQAMTVQELVDVVEYLSTLKKATN